MRSLASLYTAVPTMGALQFWNILVLEHSFPSMHHSLSVYKSYSHMFAPLQFFSIRASCFAPPPSLQSYTNTFAYILYRIYIIYLLFTYATLYIFCYVCH